MNLFYVIVIFFPLFFSAQDYTFRCYNMDQGLPQNSIKDITKDKYGFIWLSTDGGILRYDGHNFLLYNNFKTSNLSFGSFLRTKNRDFICFNNNDENCVLISDRTVKMLPNGKISKTYSMGNNVQYKRYYKSSFINNFFPETNCYYVISNSGTYFFNNRYIIYKKENKPEKKILAPFLMKELRNAFEHENIIFLPDQKNRKTIILKNGIVSYDNKPSLYNDPGSRIYWHQGTGQVFVINNGNIYRSKISNGILTLTFLMRYKKIEKELLYCMFYDEGSNKLYLGNVLKGLKIINLSNFYTPQKNVPFSGEFVYEALPFTSNSIISKQGFEYYKDKVNKIYSADFNYDRRYLLYDNSLNILYVEYNKIHRRYRSSHYQAHDSINFPQRNVEGIFKAGNNFVVNMADSKYQYYYLNIFADDQFKKTKSIFRFKANINFVKELNKDSMYVGTTDGIYLVSNSKNKILKHFAKNLPIKEIQQTKDGNFWFTTHNRGFYLLKNDNEIRIPEDKNGYLSSAHHILEDHYGFFWISSNNGLFKVSKKSLLEYAKNKKTKVIWYRYTKEDGLLNNEFNGSANPSGNILENEEFVFPSMEGFVFFKPGEIRVHYPRKNQLFIERAQVGKETIKFTDTLYLKSDYKNAEILLDFPYYHNIENIYIEARLEGSSNSKWEKIKNDRKFILNNAEPGDYKLNIRFLGSEDGQFIYKQIVVKIKPFFYQTIWFKSFMIVLGIMFVVLIIYARTNFLKRMVKTLKHTLNSKDQELEITANKLKNETEYQQKIMESISHDITTPIRFLVSISQRLNSTKDNELQKKYFDEIYHTSEQLFKFTLDLKEYTSLFKEENIFDKIENHIHILVQSKKLLFDQIALANNTTLYNLCDPHITTRVNHNILSSIVHNLIDNAVKNTQNGKVFIETEQKGEKQIEITISDTGKGMSQDQLEYYSFVFENMEKDNFVFKNYGLGLHMVIQLTKKINAKITFHKNTPKGTIIKIFLKN